MNCRCLSAIKWNFNGTRNSKILFSLALHCQKYYQFEIECQSVAFLGSGQKEMMYTMISADIDCYFQFFVFSDTNWLIIKAFSFSQLTRLCMRLNRIGYFINRLRGWSGVEWKVDLWFVLRQKSGSPTKKVPKIEFSTKAGICTTL